MLYNVMLFAHTNRLEEPSLSLPLTKTVVPLLSYIVRLFLTYYDFA